MMRELLVMETTKMTMAIVVIRSVVVEVNCNLVSLVTFSNAMFCCVIKSVANFWLNIA